MPDNDPEDRNLPETQTDVERGGSGKPPRRTAVGLADFGEFYRSKKWSLKRTWDNFLLILGTYFRSMDRGDQEQLIVRLCQVVTVGCAIILTTFFYQFVPLLVRVFALPLFIVGSWFVATRVVAPIIIAQFEDKLNVSLELADTLY